MGDPRGREGLRLKPCGSLNERVVKCVGPVTMWVLG